MNNMKLYVAGVLILMLVIPLSAENRCDRSTPEKFYKAFSWCCEDIEKGITAGELYDTASAKAIDDYEGAAAKSIQSFNTFMSKIKTGFNPRFREAGKNKFRVTISSDGISGGKTEITWKFSATSIMEDIKALLPGDVIFHDADCKDNICVSRVAIAGDKKKIRLVMTQSGYRIKLDEDDIKNFTTVTIVLNRLTLLFNTFSDKIDKGIINESNFSETMMTWKNEFDEMTK